MNKEQRKPWLALTEGTMGYIMCSLCRYVDWYNWPSMETDTSDWEMRCKHPLDAVADRFETNGIGPGDDCWGFRPRKGETVAAVIARDAMESGDE